MGGLFRYVTVSVAQCHHHVLVSADLVLDILPDGRRVVWFAVAAEGKPDAAVVADGRLGGLVGASSVQPVARGAIPEYKRCGELWIVFHFRILFPSVGMGQDLGWPSPVDSLGGIGSALFGVAAFSGLHRPGRTDGFQRYLDELAAGAAVCRARLAFLSSLFRGFLRHLSVLVVSAGGDPTDIHGLGAGTLVGYDLVGRADGILYPVRYLQVDGRL